MNYTFYFMLSWLPLYLVRERGFSTVEMGAINGSAFALNAASALLAGWAIDRYIKSGGSGKTIVCSICHGDDLKGLGDVPRIAGLHPVYIVRQLYAFQGTDYSGTSAALMKKVVQKLSEDDMIAIAAYAASLAP